MTTPPRKPDPPARKFDFSKVFANVGSTEPMYEAVDFSKVGPRSPRPTPMPGDAGSDASAMTRTYTVAKGDTLAHIAKHFYGKASRWREIFEANRDQLDDPDRIYPGQVLKIPADPH